MDNKKLILGIVVALIALYFLCNNKSRERFVDVDMEVVNPTSGREVLSNSGYPSMYNASFGQPMSEGKILGAPVPRSYQAVPDIMNITRQVRQGNQNLSDDEIIAQVRGGMSNPQDYLPAPDSTPFAFGKDPTDPSTFLPERQIIVNSKTKLLDGTDYIRGDLPIAPMVGSWFVSAGKPYQLRRGALQKDGVLIGGELSMKDITASLNNEDMFVVNNALQSGIDRKQLF